MKATINNVELLKALKKVSSVIKKNPVIPVLSSFKLDFEKNKVKVTGTDLETTYITTVDCVADKKFTLLIESLDLLKICEIASSPIEISSDEKHIEVNSGKLKYKLPFIGDTSLYPIEPDVDSDIDIDLDADFFYHSSKAELFHSNEILKVSHNRVGIDIAKDVISIIGVDGMVLYKGVTQVKNKKDRTFMVPDTFINSCKLFQDSKLRVGEKYVSAEYNDDKVISLLPVDKFVDYKSVLPKDVSFNSLFDKNEMVLALKSLLVSANEKAKIGVFYFADDKISMSATDIDFDKTGENEIEAENKDLGIKIGLNIEKLLLILNNINSSKIQMSVTENNKPAYIKPENSDEVFCMIMTVLI